MSELVSRRVTGHAEEFLGAFRIVIVNGPTPAPSTQRLARAWPIVTAVPSSG
ncbi:hypothetical protein AB0L53_19760 [Nonomuraea sp. NPDC052129]|uniref:hypothetical protein n=1 Tax=Nonomuraea sp. NPDC052129 TaxID=3154651 RepID=UPI003447B366